MNFIFYVGPGIGDIVMMLEVAKVIKNKYSDSNIDCFMNQPSGYNRHSVTNNIMNYQHVFRKLYYYSSKEILHDIELIRELRSNNYEKGYVFQYGHTKKVSKIPALIMNLSGCKSVGFNYKGNFCLKKYEYDSKKTIVERCLRVMEMEGYPINNIGEVLDRHEFEKESLRYSWDKKRKAVGLCIGSGLIGLKIKGKNYTSSAKNWILDNWINLANSLIQKGFVVILLGSESEFRLLQESNCKIDERIINAVSKCSLGESIKLLDELDMVVGGDTGLMHIAAALGKKTLSLFGCTSPKDYLPFGSQSHYIFKNYDCSPCIGKEASIYCENRKCMENISMQEVLVKILELLKHED